MLDLRRKSLIALLCMGTCEAAFALTSGPTQPEFTSFEPVDVTDLVNMPTGDFTYVLPLGDVKGPTGVGYPVALSYHAGICSEQEASWVGLGWTLNVGAINRQVVGFPDDDFKSSSVSFLANKGENGGQTTLGLGWQGYTVDFGWTNKGFQGITGIGYSYGAWNLDVNTNSVNVGYGGYASVGYNWNSNMFQAGYRGLTIGIGSGSASIGYGATIANGVALNGSVTFGKGQAPYYCGSIALSSGPSSGATFSLDSKGQGGVGISALGASYQHNYASFSEKGQHSYSSSEGFSAQGPYGITLRFSNYSWGWYFQQISTNKAFGYLYHSPQLSRIVETNDRLLPYFSQNAGFDNTWGYETFPKTLSGMMKQRAPTQGSLGTFGSAGGTDNPFTDLEESGDRLEYIKCNHMTLPSQDIYSVNSQGISGVFKPFAYKSLNSTWSTDNSKDGLFWKDASANPKVAFNTNTMKISPFFSDGLVFKMISENSMNLIDNADLGTDDYSSNNLKNIHSLTDGTAGKVCGTQIVPIFGTKQGTEILEGFTLTDLEGKTYFYTLPLKNLNQVTVCGPSQTIPQGLSTAQTTSYSYSTQPFATTWLLTAITGPDWIKMTGDYLHIDPTTGLPQVTTTEAILPREGDFGYWAKFSYRYDENTPKATMLWRNPYNDFIKRQINGTDMYTTVFGQKEITYLSAIETASEIAYFRTEDRADGQGIDQAAYPNIVLPYPLEGETKPQITTYYKYYCNRVHDQDLQTSLNNVATAQSYYVFTGSWNVKLKGAPLSWYSSMPENTEMMVMNAKATATYSPCGIDFIWCWGHPTADATAGFHIYKDTQRQLSWPASSLSNDRGTIVGHFTNYIACTGASYDAQTDYLHLTLTSYSKVDASGADVITGCSFTTPDYVDACHCNTLSNPDISSYVLNNTSFINNVNPIVTVQKRLKEVAWYSKSQYPFLVSEKDPADPDYASNLPSNFPMPQSYRRVALNYSYELAPNTPNSSDRGKGRLALKAVTSYGGFGTSETSMPPYLFSYQNANSPYLGPDNADPWGYEKVDKDGPQDVSLQGINWNLSRIDLPSGGSISIDYGRDSAYTSLATIYRIKREHPGTELDNTALPPATYYDQYSVASANSDTRQLTLTASVDPSIVGTYFIAYCDVAPGQKRMFDYCDNVQDVDLESYHYLYKIIDQQSPNVVTVEQNLPDGIQKIYALKKDKLLCDGIRVHSITLNTGMSQLTTQYTYDAGDVHLLPQDAIPTLFTKSYTASATTGTNCYDTYTQVDRYIDYIPFSTDIEKNYSDGCTSIIYPAVEVAQVNSVGKKVRGSIKSSFWTNSDLVLPGTPSVSINKILTNVNFIPVIQVWDRSGIVGMAKKVEYLDNNGSTVYSKENTYAFSETVAGIAGVVFGDLSTLVGDNTPLGMIRQRSKELDASGNVDTITDLIISKPFLVETHEVKDNVAIINTFYGLFDAFTGNPTATLTTNGNQDKKLTISVPYNYMITSRENEDLTEKNMYTLPGGSIVVDATNMPITKLADISFGTFSSSMDKIKCGTAQTYQVENVTTDAIFPQFRFSKLAAFTMTDFTDDQTSLQWPTMGGTNWLNKSQIAMVDKFSRPLTEVVPMEGPATAIYHPRMNAVCGLVKNAEYYECGVLTCDYDEQNSLFPGDFDHENGWENGGATVVSGGHFGKKCVHIVNAFGPTHNFKVSSSKNYILSVNAKVNSGSLFLWAEYRDKAGPYEISAWPIPDGDLTPPLKDPKNLSNDLSDYLMVSLSDAQDWKKFELLISTSTKLPRSTGYIRVWIGNGNGNVDALVDDIRFFPADAHVSSFYYDQNLAQPIAFVDENGKMKGFEYDVFGRLKAIKNNAGQTLKTATYSSGDPSTVTGAIRITKPVNGAALVRSNGTLPIQWATYGIVGNVTLKYSVDNKATWTTIAGSQANSGSYTWLLPSGLAATADVWIRVEESLKSDLVFDETGASFRIVNYAARNRSFVSQFIMDLIGNAGGD